MDTKFSVLATVGGVVIAAAGLGYTYLDGERNNSRANDLSFSQFSAQLARLETNFETSLEKDAERERASSGAITKLEKALKTERDRIGELEAKIAELSKSNGLSATVAPEEVAAVLARDYAYQLTGPQGPAGPRGEAGPVGPKGDTGPAGPKGADGTSVGIEDPSGPIVIAPETWQSDFPDQNWGATQVSLLGCSSNGRRIDCYLIARPGQDHKIDLWAKSTRAALQDGQWLQANEVTFGQKSSSRLVQNLSADIPTKFSFGFNSPVDPGDGLLQIEVVENYSKNTIKWKSIPFK